MGSGALHCVFGLARHILASGGLAGIVKSAILEVAVRKENARRLAARRACGAIEVSGYVVPRHREEGNLLDGVTLFFDLTVNRSLQRGLLRHGPEAVGHQYLFAHLPGPALPGLSRSRDCEREIAVEVLRFTQPGIGRLLFLGQDSPGLVTENRGGEEKNQKQRSHERTFR